MITSASLCKCSHTTTISLWVALSTFILLTFSSLCDDVLRVPHGSYARFPAQNTQAVENALASVWA